MYFGFGPKSHENASNFERSWIRYENQYPFQSSTIAVLGRGTGGCLGKPSKTPVWLYVGGGITPFVISPPNQQVSSAWRGETRPAPGAPVGETTGGVRVIPARWGKPLLQHKETNDLDQRIAQRWVDWVSAFHSFSHSQLGPGQTSISLRYRPQPLGLVTLHFPTEILRKKTIIKLIDSAPSSFHHLPLSGVRGLGQ